MVAYLVKNYAPEAKGHGVPEVMEAIHYHRGRMRPIVAVIKSFASALSIGSGGSVGREGPIVQIGSAFSATIGELLHLPTWQRITLIAAGAGGGIAATFNTPVGGVLFALELMLHEVSVRTLVPVTIATVAATYIRANRVRAASSLSNTGFRVTVLSLDESVRVIGLRGFGRHYRARFRSVHRNAVRI